MSTTTPFGIIPAGLPLITEPTQSPSPTSFLYALPAANKSFSHVVVFLLPNVTLPPGTAAAIYLSTAAQVSAGNPSFRFLGGIGPGKESAMFKVSGGGGSSELVIGVDVESEETVGARMQELAVSKGTSVATQGTPPSTAVLAQRIIQNAFNFLTGFSGTAGPGGVEVVPLRAFEDWWRKFESRVRADPSFLEKQAD